MLVLFAGWTFVVAIVSALLGATLYYRRDAYRQPIPDMFGPLRDMTNWIGRTSKDEPVKTQQREPVRDGL